MTEDEKKYEEYQNDLCIRMLTLAMHADGTQELRASEIKDLLIPFFGIDMIQDCVERLCGKSPNGDKK
jgi:hypothetical protein